MTIQALAQDYLPALEDNKTFSPNILSSAQNMAAEDQFIQSWQELDTLEAMSHRTGELTHPEQLARIIK